MGSQVGIGKNRPVNRLSAVPTMSRETMLLLLTGAAGSVDAISYLGLGHDFTAMMTGNTALLGLALGQGHILAAWRSILALLGFAAGVASGATVVHRDSRQGDWPPAVQRIAGGTRRDLRVDGRGEQPPGNGRVLSRRTKA
jgi:hypothetical protein